MNKLNHYKFNSLYEMSSGISSKPEQAGHGSPFLSFSTVFNNYFLPEQLDNRMETSSDEQQKHSIKNGDLFLTRTSEVVDELGMSSVALKDYPKATYSGFLKRLRPTQKNITYSKFMAFYLRSRLFRKTMTNNAVLTLRASLNENIFSYLDLLLPKFDEQVKAGDLLYLLSQKITLNNRINAELEAMAKTLYDYWFVQFDFPDANGKPYKSSGGKMIYNPTLKRKIPAGWDSIYVGEVLGKIQASKKVPNKEILGVGTIPVIDQSMDYICGFTNDESARLKVNSAHIIFGDHTRILKLITFDYARGADGTQALISAIEEMPEHLFYQMLKDIDLSSYGYARHFKFLKEFLVVRPGKTVAKQYESIAQNIFKKVEQGLLENQQLAQIRDWLLPMLMNGQITVA